MSCIFGVYCRDHGFIHGAEAEELRQRFQALADGQHKPLRADIRAILEDVDARDSLAYLEAKALIDAGQDWGDDDGV